MGEPADRGEETLRLLDEARAGSREAFERAVELNLPLVRAVAARFFGIADADDLIQTGSIGLIKAAERFDPTRGVKFSSYAVPMIAGEIRRSLRGAARERASLFAPRAGWDAALADTLPDGSEMEARAVDRVTAEQAVEKLCPVEKKLVLLRFYCGLTQTETAAQMGLSQPKVCRTEKKAIESLRKLME